MFYFVFDLDATLAEMESVYYFITSLKIQSFFQNSLQYLASTVTSRFEEKLNQAYTDFVKQVATEETSENPLGILRPGIFKIMEELYAMKKQGKIKGVIIYSNNSHLGSLEFIRDVIHSHLGARRFIVDCIHLDHPMREEANMLRELRTYNKTWMELRRIMVEGDARAPHTLKPTNIFFFDDQIHPDLKEQLKEKYYHVPAYTYVAPFGRIRDIYTACIQRVQLDLDAFHFYVTEAFPIQVFPFAEILQTDKERMDSIISIFYALFRTSRPRSGSLSHDKSVGAIEHAIQCVKYHYRILRSSQTRKHSHD